MWMHCSKTKERHTKKHWRAKPNAKGFMICPASGMEVAENDYCSYGERREEADENA